MRDDARPHGFADVRAGHDQLIAAFAALGWRTPVLPKAPVGRRRVRSGARGALIAGGRPRS